ncbi:hypothetical protein TNCV_3341481 [Trichonephila clavipes]|nr:hypothetical protein TNCV_3341481 [Trichonephila clavipes]
MLLRPATWRGCCCGGLKSSCWCDVDGCASSGVVLVTRSRLKTTTPVTISLKAASPNRTVTCRKEQEMASCHDASTSLDLALPIG